MICLTILLLIILVAIALMLTIAGSAIIVFLDPIVCVLIIVGAVKLICLIIDKDKDK